MKFELGSGLGTCAWPNPNPRPNTLKCDGFRMVCTLLATPESKID